MVTTDKGTEFEGPAGPPAGPSIVPRGVARLTLIAVTVAVFAETLRYSLPAFSNTSVGGALGFGLLAAAAAFLAPAIRALRGPRWLVVIGVGGLLLTRVVAQGTGPVLNLAVVGTAFGLLALPALYESSRGLSGVGFSIAATAGLAFDTSVRMLFGTWDGVWRDGIGPWAVCLVVVAVGIAALAREMSSPAVPFPGISWRDALGAAALGPFIALQVLVLSNPAFVASSGWLSLTTACYVVWAGHALALAFLASGLAVRAVPGGVGVLGGTLLGVCAGAVAGTYALDGKVVVIAVVPAQLLAAWLLAVACRAPLRLAGTGGPIWRVDLGAALGGLALVAILVPYTLNPEHPLPFPNNALSGIAGILLGLLAAIAAARGGPLPARAPQRALTALGACLLLLIPPFVFGRAAAVPASGAIADEVRVVSLNIDQAMHGGRLDPERIAALVEARDADVVTLQDVGRGATASGTADLGVWLSQRLGMTLVWGPAADSQYGNAILTSLPVKSTGTARVFNGDEVRGYVWARIGEGDRTIDVWTTRLAPGDDADDARAAEMSALVKAWSGAPRTIVTGDLGTAADAEEISVLTSAGLRRAPGTLAQGVTQNVFGTDDVVFGQTSVDDGGLIAVTAKVG
ncbi:endonuclease/exonuclease/phosphatase family protein [Actinocorallia sp. A-T 12471]|uniref:endonuclease/exonuclease/phosphatase family protein n=1 Tax=Actinocorallia sp. A-T 12471 TaxID=3089813 RepID=UPI0029D0DF3B|nr:endonuclease/exonuclease/phosphatase family protein [Actinocorallia sp. A-T 12471]MDX6743001.1 endonuclease/exonuclease/phosphatase [Actinocorallia sp. A-T 12471]